MSKQQFHTSDVVLEAEQLARDKEIEEGLLFDKQMETMGKVPTPGQYDDKEEEE